MCQRRAQDAITTPTEVPPRFWESETFVEGLASQHMGRICRAYREYPFHHALFGTQGIPQGIVGGWLGGPRRTSAESRTAGP